jgi:hypothetical protein
MQNREHEEPDYGYWLKAKVWDTKEAAALILGYDPDYLWSFRPDPEDADKHDFDFAVGEDPRHTELKGKASSLERLLRRAYVAGDFGKPRLNQVGEPWGKTVTASQWINWAKKNDITCAQELLAAQEQSKNMPREEKDDLHPRTETSLLRIIGALLQELRSKTGQSQSSIIETVVDLHGHKSGISRSTLENYFSLANRRLDDW